jgi:hypothetical protein
VAIPSPSHLLIKARVAFAAEQPLNVAHGGRQVPPGRRWTGDTVTMHGSPSKEIQRGGTRLVEVVANGRVLATAEVPADGAIHDLEFRVEAKASSWIALRHFPQLHTNPVNVMVGGGPIRASRDSARWCAATIEQLWTARNKSIPESERPAARAAFDEALVKYRQIAAESAE